MLKQKAQSTLEYVIILSAIVIAVLAARNLVQTATQNNVQSAATAMDTATNRMTTLGQ
jgi:uncharacterized protein (UPF0333 family)